MNNDSDIMQRLVDKNRDKKLRKASTKICISMRFNPDVIKKIDKLSRRFKASRSKICEDLILISLEPSNDIKKETEEKSPKS